MTFKVKAGVQLPARRTGGSPERRKYPFDTIRIGETFFVPDKTTQQLATYASLRGRELSKKFRTQTMHMRQDLQTDEWEPCRPGAVGAHKGVAITRTL